jgi:alpha,alpha-trehalase
VPIRRLPSRPQVQMLLIAFVLALCALPAACQQPPAAPARLQPILKYISDGWSVLTRSMTECNTVVDPKLGAAGSVIYIPAGFAAPAAVQDMEKKCGVRVQPLPAPIHSVGQVDVRRLQPPGLLYLPNPYVVPGGRFNEMYGWDSYFELVGLLRDNRVDLARGMVDNFLFEIEHYGTVLNANRSYYLTRSQPPFLTTMVLAVYAAETGQGRAGREWLARAYTLAARDYEMWNREPHLAGTTGLSRYFDFGQGPAPESVTGEPGYYRAVAGYFLLHPEAANPRVLPSAHQEAESEASGPIYAARVCDNAAAGNPQACDTAGNMKLSADYYKGDRSVRESGFDVSFRFGAYSADTHHFAPVCLNSLLYKTEKDLEKISRMLGRASDAQQWAERAELRKTKMSSLFWDAAREMFFDYEIPAGRRSTYEYITTFYPLWAGLATPEQARALVRNLSVFEQPGGLAMSRHETGVQWDLPYGWAPTQYLAIEGLRGYGFNDDANRLAYKFVSTVLENFQRDGTIREKYNVVTRSSETNVAAGYKTNVVGFGWTNGVFLALLHELPPDWTKRLDQEQVKAQGGVASPGESYGGGKIRQSPPR